MQTALIQLPESLENTENKEYLTFENTEILDTEVSKSNTKLVPHGID